MFLGTKRKSNSRVNTKKLEQEEKAENLTL
jgi:hypothetical protein